MMKMSSEILDAVVAERGGFVDAEGCAVAWPVASLLDMQLAVTSGAGGGSTFFLCELIVQALASERTVRIIDNGFCFRKLCQLLNGVHLTSWEPETWISAENHLVVIDLEGIPRIDWQTVIYEIQETPATFWLLATEAWAYDNYQIDRANCISSLDHVVARSSQICGFVKSKRMPPTLSSDARAFLSRGVEPGVRSPWVLLHGEVEHRFYMTAGPLRATNFSNRLPIAAAQPDFQLQQ